MLTLTWRRQRGLGLRRNTRSIIEPLQSSAVLTLFAALHVGSLVAFHGEPRGFPLERGGGVVAVSQWLF